MINNVGGRKSITKNGEGEVLVERAVARRARAWVLFDRSNDQAQMNLHTWRLGSCSRSVAKRAMIARGAPLRQPSSSSSVWPLGMSVIKVSLGRSVGTCGVQDGSIADQV
jgi:hypothetical protein